MNGRCGLRGLRRQHGAVGLLAALFLITAVLVMGQALLRQSASSANDSLLAHDGVSALFLAESGVERSAQRLAEGTACADLAEPGIRYTFGRGDFEIQTAADNTITGWCDVRILGRALLGGTPNAQRQIEVALQPGGGVAAWAVGAGGAIHAWTGSSWTAAASGTSAQLNAVHCVSPTECWTVGNGGTIRRWTGSTWDSVASGTGATLRGVACIQDTPTACYAVGNDVVRRWNGSAWVNSSFSGGLLTAVSCTSSTCYAVEDQVRIWRLNTATNAWVIDASFNGYNWNGIHCLASGECWAVGNPVSNRFTFARLLAGSWSIIPYNATPPRGLNAIHCMSSDNCWAAGRARSGGLDTLIRRNSGGFSYITPVGGHDLYGISCNTSSECLTVGSAGDVQYWNGGGWSPATSGMAAVNLYGVAMTDAEGSGGAVQVMRWREIIN